jgi:competence protein ComEC
MKQQWLEVKEQCKIFFNAYGKITLSSFCFLVGLVSLCFIISTAAPQKLRVSFLDIGQGDSILIQTPSGHEMLIDGGPTHLILARLNEQMNYFDRDIEVVVATHGDADHVTGLIPVLENYTVRKIVHSPVEANTGIFDDLVAHIKQEGAEVHSGEKGDEIDFGDGVTAHILYPNKTISSKTDTNDASVSMVLTYGKHSFLLTGDLTTKYESQLIESKLPKNITVYKAGHHGSKTSSGEQLLTYIKPEYAVISAGKENKYGHPNPETVERLQKYSKEILSTIDHGTISFFTDGKMIEVVTQK